MQRAARSVVGPPLGRHHARRVVVFLLCAVFGPTSGSVAAGQPKILAGTGNYVIAGGDTAVNPGDDFNMFANGTYLARLKIPAHHTSYGVDEMLAEKVDRQVREILEGDRAESPETAPDLSKARTLYRAFMDQHRIDAAGAKPLSPDLAAIRQAQTKADLAALMGASVRGFEAALFDVSIDIDARRPDRYAVIVSQSGLGLPDRDYYLLPQFAAERAKYRGYVAQALKSVGWPDANARARAVLAYESRIAEASWAAVEERDPNRAYNPTTPAGLAAAAPGFDWVPFLAAAGLGGVRRLVVQENTSVPRLAAIYAETPVATLKAWAAFHLVDNAAPYLARPFADAHFAFHKTVLAGQLRQSPRWERAVALVNSTMGEAVGRRYVAAFFPLDTKAQITAMAGNLRRAFAARVQQVAWMGPETRQRATQKLAQLTVKVGYPAKWRDYSELDVRAADLYGDVARATTFEWNRRLARLDQPVDHAEWEVPPQTIDAYYEPRANEVVLPAAILQAPYFDARFGAAANYGSIGALIGHEMTHGFDDEGRGFDGTGTLVDWWTEEDAREFNARAGALAAQYARYEPHPGVRVNGSLTNGENIADLGGLLVALDAYHRFEKYEPVAATGGLTGDQRFFVAYAQSWREKRREAAVRRMVVSDPHAPEQYRINGVLRNVDAWYDAFTVVPGDKLYLDPTARVHIW